MRQPSTRATPHALPQARVAVKWLAVAACAALLAYVVFGVARQVLTAPPALRLILVRDVPLPSSLGLTSARSTDPLAPGVEAPFDRFDFEAYDAQTHKLFIAHSGPNPSKLLQARIPFDPKTDGHIVVFDTQRQRVIGRVNIPHVTGLVVAGDERKVYASDMDDNTVYAINEDTLAFKPIPVGNNANPDAISYDQPDHRIFVSDLGASANPNKTANADRSTQNLVVIDTLADTIVAKINIGNLPKLSAEHAPTDAGTNIPSFGYSIGHSQYDGAQGRVFVTTQILPNADNPNPNNLPPPATGELMAIDPLQATVVQRVILPATCITPHGLALDTEQEVAFIACVDVDPAHKIAPNLARVDLREMMVIPADSQQMRLAPNPDIVRIDHAAHVVIVGCRGGISIFDERPGKFHKLGEYQIGKATHSIALDEETQYLYIPINAGGRPVLRVVRYNASGA